MPLQIYVAGASHISETVARALPDMDVLDAPLSSRSEDEAFLANADCLMVGPNQERLLENAFERMPVVELLCGETAEAPVMSGRVPVAHVTSPAELRLAIRSATLEYRTRRLFADLAGPWAHDARGALGVGQLALKLMEAGAEPSSVIQKVENGLTRLGYLTERIPSQIALALDLPLSNHSSASLFPSLDSFVLHLRRIHARRSVELLGGDAFGTTTESARFVPFAAGFVEFAVRLSDARAALKMTIDQHRTLQLECECPNRPAPFDASANLDGAALTRRGEVLPYRLVEAAHLAARLGVALTLELTESALLARVQLV